MAVDPPGPGRRTIPRRPGSAAQASETLRRTSRAGSGAAGRRAKPLGDSGRGDDRRTRRTGAQRAVIALGGVLSVLVLLAACTVGYFNWRLGQIDRIELGLAEASGGPENYLVVGSDSREGIGEDDADAGAFLDNEEYRTHPDGTGRRSDTIMILRLDPSSKEAKLLSFPRDLYVPIAGTDRSDKINAAFAIGVPTLIDTIQENFRVPINHYVEVDFVGFKKLIDAMGGVDLYFDKPMWDDHTGLNVATVGCHNLDGTEALAFARSRYLWYNTLGQPAVDTSSLRYMVDSPSQMEANGWYSDGTSDLGRISRQQVLIRNAIPQAEAAAFRNPATLNAIMASVVDSVRVDEGLSSGRMLELANRFRNFDPDELTTYSFPGTPDYAGSAGAILRPDERAAERILARFRGEQPAGPQEGIPVRVLNGSGVDKQAANVAGALERVGFTIEGTADAASEGIGEVTVTQVRYAPANEYNARIVAKHLSAPVELVPLEGATSSLIEVVTGSNFTTVSTEMRPLDDSELPPTTTTPESGSTSGDDGAATTSTTSTTLIGVVPEQSKSC